MNFPTTTTTMQTYQEHQALLHIFCAPITRNGIRFAVCFCRFLFFSNIISNNREKKSGNKPMSSIANHMHSFSMSNSRMIQWINASKKKSKRYKKRKKTRRSDVKANICTLIHFIHSYVWLKSHPFFSLYLLLNSFWNHQTEKWRWNVHKGFD